MRCFLKKYPKIRDEHSKSISSHTIIVFYLFEKYRPQNLIWHIQYVRCNNIHYCTIFMAYSISSEVVLKMFFEFCSFHWMEPLMFPKKTESSAVRLAMAPTDSNCNLHKDSTTFFLCTRIFLGGFKPYHHLWWFFPAAEETYDATVTVEREFLPPAHLCPSLVGETFARNSETAKHQKTLRQNRELDS